LKQKIKTTLSAGWNELHDWMEQLSVKMKGIENEEEVNKEKLDKLLQWLLAKQGLVCITSGRVEATSGRVKVISGRVKATSGRVKATSDYLNYFRYICKPKKLS